MASPIRITLAYGNSRRIANPRSPESRAANGSRTNASSNSASCARQAATISAVSLTCVIAPFDGIRLIMHQSMASEHWATQIPVDQILEFRGFEVYLVNAHHVKNL